ncbi:MAG TPA: MBL fold metallo-hydrolase [Acidimicrobiales bacterium]
MIFEQYYLDCLSQASYLVGDDTTGQAVVVDPRRDVDEYIDDAKGHGLTIVAVAETHFHADFVSGHLELADRTGAEIIYGEAADPDFAHRKVADGEQLALGEVVLEFRATPGHTPESISIVIWEHADDSAPFGVLTGDTLFIGDVGRPDLLASSGVTADELGRMLHESLRTKLLTLPDTTRVFPAHGAGSACGKQLSTETSSTIGEQRSTNYALRPMTTEEFISVVTEGQSRAPDYFSFDADRNRHTHPLLDQHAPDRLAVDDVVDRQQGGAVVIDTRDAASFARGHLRGSINVGLEGRFAEYVGSVVDPDDDIVIVGEEGMEAEARVRLGRIGFDRVSGHLPDVARVLAQRPELAATASRLTAAVLRARMAEHDVDVVDIREAGERTEGAIPGAIHIPLRELRHRLDEIRTERPVVIHCAGGYRSSIGASLLRRRGWTDVSDLLGGYGAWASS